MVGIHLYDYSDSAANSGTNAYLNISTVMEEEENKK